MQLVAYGAQDVYLSGNPQITFFKVVYRRHTNFSVEPVQQTWNGAADFGRTVTCNINRNGDLITNMYVVVKLPATVVINTNTNESIPSKSWGYVNRLGHALISNVKIEIGGSKIDEQYGDWLNIWYELTHKVGQERGYAKMIGDVPELTAITTITKPAYNLYIPLQFWFNRNNGLALPLIALQYHDVRITLTFRPFNECINYTQNTEPPVVSMTDSFLLIDYVYLDSEERKRFAQASHEYLIEQLQFTGSESWNSANSKLRLNFNHPSKYLVWAPHSSLHNTRTSWVVHSTNGDWEAARERFAIIIACIFSQNFTYANNNQNISTGGTGQGNDIYRYTPTTSLSPDIKILLDKIIVDYIATESDPSITGTPITIFSNSVIIKNELTMEDITYSVEWLLSQWELTYKGTSLSTIAMTNLRQDVNTVLNFWTYNIVNYHNYGLCQDGSVNLCSKAKLQLNGHDRFQEREGSYFNYVQPAQHFSNTPADGINVYSFALKAEDHQPTGTCNFSRIDNATLNVSSDKTIPSGTILNIYTQNYNVLRVMSGMAGTAYSN
jgi:hypothetical protein